MPIDARPTVAAPDDDPYLWLEEIEGARRARLGRGAEQRHAGEVRQCRLRAGIATRWPPFSTGRTTSRSSRAAGRTSTISGRMRTIRAACGGARRSTASAREQPDWEVLLDVDALAAQEERGLGLARRRRRCRARTIAPSCSLSRGGGDAAVLREFDIAAKAFVSGGFYLPEAKGGADWLDRDTLLLSSAYGGGTWRPQSGYARTVRLWRRGSDVAQAPVLYRDDAREHGAVGLRRPHARRRDGLVRRQAGLLRYHALDRRPHRRRR